jgi:putative ABC transport system permease protein
MFLYRVLLRLYPSSFRAEYGTEMVSVFASELRNAPGIGAKAVLWGRAIADAVSNALRAHNDILRQDLRYIARTLVRMPGFALTVILVAALGIGATTAAFSVANHVFLRPLPFPDSARLVQLWQDQTVLGYGMMELSPGNYRDWKAHSRSFENMAVYTDRAANLVGMSDPVRLQGAFTTWELFGVLGIRPAMGRDFTEADDRPGAPGVVVLSDGAWRTVFGADPNVVGRKVLLDDEPNEVIAVMPRTFFFPSREAQFWKPVRFAPENFEDRADSYIKPVARLRQGVTVAQAEAELDVIAERLARAFPDANKGIGAFVHRLQDRVSDRSRLMVAAFLGASLCVLLIACTNLANLLLSRSLSRQRELAVRMALGAGIERVMRQLLTESLVLAGIGGAAGVLIAYAANPLVARLVPTTLPIADVPPIDLRVLLFAAIVTCLTGIGFGIVPALRVRRDAAMSGLREGGRAGTSPGTQRIRSTLVIAEVAASVVLLVSAGLLVRALVRVQQIDPGFRSEGVLTMRTELPLPKYAITARRHQFYDAVLRDVKALPGVSDAAFTSSLPMVWRGGIWPVTPDATKPDPASSHVASLRQITTGFFSTLGIPIVQGRDVSDSDLPSGPPVAVVSQSFVQEHWPGQNPLGRVFFIAFAARTVVGVVGDIRFRGLERTDSEPQVYVASRQIPDNQIVFYSPKDLAIKASVPLAGLVPSVRQIIARADSQQPIADIRPLVEIVEEETAPREVQLRALGAFALVAFVLAALGIHGLLAFHVSTRLHEIGVRMALGADSRTIVRLIAGHAVALTAAGLAIGLVLSWNAGKWLSALLAGVSPADLPTFAAAALLALVMAASGSVLPVARALRVSPLVALRSE